MNFEDKNKALVVDELFWVFEGNKYFNVRVFLPFVSSVYKCDKKEPLQNIIKYFKTFTKKETERQNNLIKAQAKQVLKHS